MLSNRVAANKATAFCNCCFWIGVLCIRADARRRKGGVMLTQRSPSAITTRIVCIACGGQMPLTLVEPAYDDKRVDTHVFTCGACGVTEEYAFDRDLKS